LSAVVRATYPDTAVLLPTGAQEIDRLSLFDESTAPEVKLMGERVPSGSFIGADVKEEATLVSWSQEQRSGA
jgi:hypothetical protein